jgi:hypothetical protein
MAGTYGLLRVAALASRCLPQPETTFTIRIRNPREYGRKLTRLASGWSRLNWRVGETLLSRMARHSCLAVRGKSALLTRQLDRDALLDADYAENGSKGRI